MPELRPRWLLRRPQPPCPVRPGDEGPGSAATAERLVPASACTRRAAGPQVRDVLPSQDHDAAASGRKPADARRYALLRRDLVRRGRPDGTAPRLALPPRHGGGGVRGDVRAMADDGGDDWAAYAGGAAP